MLASRFNLDDDGEGESTMPGDYEQARRPSPRIAFSPGITPLRPLKPSISRPNQRFPSMPSTSAPKAWPPRVSAASPARPHRSKRRSITPEIIVERSHRHRSSSGRHHRVITIPLDYRPTLGLRGPPRRVLEIERVRCRRRRRSRSPCYEVDYGIPPRAPLQPQSNIIVANPIPSSYLPLAQPSVMVSANNSAASLALLSNLTPEMIERLPRQTVHLPPVYLPGSQANVDTELNTVIFPAEMINPIDGTLSIIQANPAIPGGANTNIQHTIPVFVQSQPADIPVNAKSPIASLGMLSGPFMQQVQDLFQRVTQSQAQSVSSPLISQHNAATNSLYHPQTNPTINTTTVGPYSPANIRPINTPHIGTYNPTTYRSSIPANIRPLNTPNIGTYNPTTYRPSIPANIRPINTPNIGTYNPTTYRPSIPANTTPYRPATITPYQSASNTTFTPAVNASYRPANITSYRSTSNTPIISAGTTSYRPSNITPYHPTNSIQSNPTNIRSNQYVGAAPSNLLDHGPYPQANITPYSASHSHSTDSSKLLPYIPFGSTPYTLSSNLTSIDSHNIPDSAINIPQSLSQTPYRSNNPMPKSILRNATSSTTYTRSNLPNILSPNGSVRKTAVFA